MSGGVLGNLISARWDGNRVPNPLMIGDRESGIAFNLADVFVLAGILLLTASLCAVTIQHRDRLIPPHRWPGAVRRRFRS
jgi:lipoprotein signal peptidase